MQSKAKSKGRPARRQPQRTCIICRTTSDKRSLVRIVRLADGSGIRIDERGKAPGRGAYLCQQASCWQTALNGDALKRALNATLSGPDQEALFAYASMHVSQSNVPKESGQ
jgi:predicted RNA-binding protein YlxR (DUF448 family)